LKKNKIDEKKISIQKYYIENVEYKNIIVNFNQNIKTDKYII
jgi:hypothetical protein